MKEIRSNRILIILLGIIFVIGISAISYAQVPRTISYQGYLTDTVTADLITDPALPVRFSLHDALTGGSELWFETQDVNVNQGVYSVDFGSSTPIPASLDFNSQYYLEVAIDEDASTTFDPGEELTPRQALTSVPYALNADTLDGQHATDFGDITGVLPGTGITGGGLSGTVTVGIGVPLVLTNNGTPPIIGVNDGQNYGVRGYNSSSGNQGMLAGPSYSVIGNSAAGKTAVYGVSSGGTGVGVEGHHSTRLNTGQLGTNNAAVSGSSIGGIAGYGGGLAG